GHLVLDTFQQRAPARTTRSTGRVWAPVLGGEPDRTRLHRLADHAMAAGVTDGQGQQSVGADLVAAKAWWHTGYVPGRQLTDRHMGLLGVLLQAGQVAAVEGVVVDLTIQPSTQLAPMGAQPHRSGVGAVQQVEGQAGRVLVGGSGKGEGTPAV